MRRHELLQKGQQMVTVLMTRPCTIATTPSSHSLSFTRCLNLRPPPPSSYTPPRSTVTTNMTTEDHHLDTIFMQKRILRARIKKDLTSMDTTLRSQEDGDSQTGKKLYVPRVEDKNCYMRMLHISRVDNLIANSMNILEPAPVDADGNDRENVMLANDPVDLMLLPGLAFDKSGRRLGRGGGYYDTFLAKYQDLVKERKWKRPLLVALSYSLQILDEGVIPLTPNDVFIDALVSHSGVIPINPAALERRS